MLSFCNSCNALYATLLFLSNNNSNVSAILSDTITSFTNSDFYYKCFKKNLIFSYLISQIKNLCNFVHCIKNFIEFQISNVFVVRSIIIPQKI